MTAGCVQW
ncbi:hypothetical protein HaLaN_08874, partial [Haematococcus lacustris]